MRSTSGFLAALTVLAAVVPAVAEADSASSSIGRAVVRDVSGTLLGTVRFDSVGRKIVISGRLTGLTVGFHAFHVHSVGICDPRATDPNGAVVPFFTAAGHLNLDASGHGHHTGDLPSLYVSADGTASSVNENDELTAAALFDADRSAIIIHSLPDNFANIPTRYSPTGPDAATLATGDAGGRVACGVITR
ncbi:superoxide dismutase family protein [Kibdelosporangium philippinense]|uniref:Superoxide dismutase [Cu-Zn] n=1 Tax=Kibdelosporangium philippinense TaxID=211113 RepID=A0ABS8ZT63_9PSEU|nr:superoxide dismutase family protein [Kibdelosporangium philippinense]MCE7010920.1 superoxide dismutase family protein [Kibdelosporangium philippinense]